MKNYLVKSVYQVTDSDWKILDRSHEGNLFEKYITMHQLSVGSYTKFLQGDWELKFFTGKVNNINQAFESTFWAIHNLWHSEPCNILYTDPDTMAIAQVDPWNQYQNFMMFNYTDPKQLISPNVYNKSYQHFFNAGVRYFPASMNPETWKIGIAIAEKWDYSTYDTEQIILNEMLWNQGLDVDAVLDPAMAWQAFMADVAFGEPWNNLPINQSKILHFHGSRGSDSRVELMKSIAKQIGTVTVDPDPANSMKPVFEDIIRNHRWNDVICGTGSTIEHTQPLREQLVPFLEKHNINSMADIPCGDFSWMSQVKFPKDFHYIGGDIVGFMIEQARQKYPGVELLEFDLSQDTIPQVDLLFCRDCLFHFSLADIQRTLDNIGCSSVKYVMFTSYYNGVNYDIKTGAFREIDFLKAPFGFPEPIDFIDENIPGATRKRRLCLWSIDTVREYVKQ
jgi:hypothetical protein